MRRYVLNFLALSLLLCLGTLALCLRSYRVGDYVTRDPAIEKRGRISFKRDTSPFFRAALLFSVAPALWLRRRTKCRRARAGQFARCGYDLTGNESGVCPECGTPA